MAPDITQGLPPDVQTGVQAALDKSLGTPTGLQPSGFTGPQGNIYDSGVGRVPAPQTPAAAPEEPEAPEFDSTDALATMFFKHMLDKDKAAQPAPPPGSMGAKIAGAMSAAGNALGDAAAATRGPGGWLSGVERTMAARQDRLAREKQQQFENQERLKNDQINYAHAQVQTLLGQQQLRHADEEDRQKALDADQATAAAIDSVGAPVVGRNMNSDDLQKWMADPKNKQDANSVTALIDHYMPPDANGYRRPVYTLYGAIPGDVKLNAQNAELLTKYGASGQEYSEGDTVNGSTLIRNLQAAKTAQIMDLNRQKIVSEVHKDDAEARKANESSATQEARNAIGHDPGFVATMNHYNNDPLAALEDATRVQNDPNASPEKKAAAGKLADNINTYFGQDVIEKYREQRADIALRRQELNNNRLDKQLNADQSKGKSLVSKATDDYAKNAQSNASYVNTLTKAQTGNELAVSMMPLFTALNISAAENVRRINQTEIEQAGPKVGSLYRQLTNLLDKAGSGTMSQDQMNEARQIAEGLQDAAYQMYVRKTVLNKDNYKLPDDMEIMGRGGSSTVTLGQAKRDMQRSDLQDYMNANGGKVPQGYSVRQNPQTKAIIYSTDQGKTWFNLSNGSQFVQ